MTNWQQMAVFFVAMAVLGGYPEARSKTNTKLVEEIANQTTKSLIFNRFLVEIHPVTY
jgi:hypothetical protein